MDPASELRNPKKVIIPLALTETLKAAARGTSFATLASQPIEEGEKESEVADPEAAS